MSIAKANTSHFHDDLKALLPRLRIHALSLTHDRDRADDLVQETVVKALAAQHSFRPGCFAAWMFRIQRNEFISGLRRQRPVVPLDDAIGNALSHPPHQEHRLVMREFLVAFAQLSLGQREALVLAVIDGQSYDEIAQHAGVSVGTIKSRVSRARGTLERLLVGAERGVAERPPEAIEASTPRRPRTARRRRSPRGQEAPDSGFGPAPSRSMV
jgi:RNA polymerase sigma-70 factor (ECF subfamily)